MQLDTQADTNCCHLLQLADVKWGVIGLKYRGKVVSRRRRIARHR
jgi:hypothetical protein